MFSFIEYFQYEDLRKEFMKNNDAAWGLEEVNRHVGIWNKVPEFMDYGILVAPNLIKFMPIYFTRKFPNGKRIVYTDESIFIPEDEFFAPGLLIGKRIKELST